MIFRFTPVVLFSFLSALLIVSTFLLWLTYHNAQEALQFEQLEQVGQTHELAQQQFNYNLNESRKTLETLSVFKLNGNSRLFSKVALDNTIWDYVIRYDKPEKTAPIIEETYGDVAEQAFEPLKQNERWILEETSYGLSLSYQFQSTYELKYGLLGTRIFKAGIYLKNNTPILSSMRQASMANAHYLVFNRHVIASSVSLERGVSETAEKILTKFEPEFTNLENPFSGDIRPLRISEGTNDLYLLSITTTEGTATWKDNFKDTIILGVQFVVLIAVIVTFLLRYLTHHSLRKLLNYANDVQEGTENAHYDTGSINEFNQVGSVIEGMVKHLSEQGKYISDMVNAANSPIIAWDKDGKITIFNKSAQTIFNLSIDDKRLNSIFDFLDYQNHNQAKKAYLDAIEGTPTSSLETKITKNGKAVFVIWSVTPFFDTNGIVSGAIAQGQNISERRRAEKRLRLSSKVFDSTAEAIMITDDKGAIVDVNTAFSDITGYERHEVIGQNPSMMKSGRHSADFYKMMWADLLEHGIWRGEIWDKRKNGEEFPKWLSISAARNEEGKLTNYVAVFSDITGKKHNERKLEQLAHFDTLTGLPNRALFHDRLYTALARSKRDKELMALLFVDLDRFKQVNDSLGHRVGDMLLKEVSKRLQHSVREIDTVARLSGDEFTVILTDLASEHDIEVVASRIVKSVGAPYFFEGHELFVSASVGIAIYPTDGETSSDLLRQADVAMYHAKEKGRNNYQFFSAEMSDKAESQLSLANKLRIALNRKLIRPHFQLKVDSLSGQPVGVEALARWSDEYGTPISPAKFIPVAEEHGLIVRLGSSILKQSCAQARMWYDMGFEFGSVAINLSAQQFRDRNLLKDIRDAMDDNRVSPEHLEIEVTENMMMDDVEGAIQILQDIKEMGLKIAIDDFGTGYSSLSYLKRFPVDTLKIDKSFVCDLTPDSDDATIVSAIVSLAQELGINVVAEGVENREQIEFLKSIDCNIVQGFYFAKPCPGGEVPLIWTQVKEEFGQES